MGLVLPLDIINEEEKYKVKKSETIGNENMVYNF